MNADSLLSFSRHHMIIKRPGDIAYSGITPRGLYERRRELIKPAGGASILGAAGLLSCSAHAEEKTLELHSQLSTHESPTAYEHVTGYNNFYEFGIDKNDPARLAGRMKGRPWSVIVDGEVGKARTFGIEELLRIPLEERIYRLRCVSGRGP